MSSDGGGPPPQSEQDPPYAPSTQALGETPSVIPDVPINAVFLILFILAAAGHMTLFRINLTRGRKFLISGMIFGFCITRIAATSLRIAWAVHPRNIPLGMAATIFVYVGIILPFIATLFFTQRLIRAQHPHIAWSTPATIVLPVLMAIMIATVLCLIAAVITQFYTPAASHLPQHATRTIQKLGITEFAIIAFLPLLLVSLSTLARLLPAIRMRNTVDKFGSGSLRSKITITIASSAALALGAAYRAGTTLLPPTAISDPKPWYFSKASFYGFNFAIEWLVVTAWLIFRIDQRFIVPDGAKGPGSYAGGFVFAGEAGNEKPALNGVGAGGRDSGRHPFARGSVGSFSSSRASTRASRVSWGGISREDVTDGVGEDGIEVLPYPYLAGVDGDGRHRDPGVAEEGLELESRVGRRRSEGEAGSGEETRSGSGSARASVRKGDEDLGLHGMSDWGVAGVEQEMGYDTKSGKWALRPVSGASAFSASAKRPGSYV